MQHPPLTVEAIQTFLQQTQKHWADCQPESDVYGFQFVRGTHWNPGLTPAELEAYQAALGIEFPRDLQCFLRHANGTEPAMVNLYAQDGHAHRYAAGVYRFPQDMPAIRLAITWLEAHWQGILEALTLESDYIGRDILGTNPQFIPFYGHRYVLSNGDADSSIVCSIQGSDAVVYGWSLEAYLQREFLPKQ